MTSNCQWSLISHKAILGKISIAWGARNTLNSEFNIVLSLYEDFNLCGLSSLLITNRPFRIGHKGVRGSRHYKTLTVVRCWTVIRGKIIIYIYMSLYIYIYIIIYIYKTECLKCVRLYVGIGIYPGFKADKNVTPHVSTIYYEERETKHK